VTVPAVSRKLHVKLLQNYEKARELAEASPWNLREGDGPWGILCNGVSYNYVKDAVADLGIAGKVACSGSGSRIRSRRARSGISCKAARKCWWWRKENPF